MCQACDTGLRLIAEIDLCPGFRVVLLPDRFSVGFAIENGCDAGLDGAEVDLVEKP